ncbi:MAG TPA: hypothetical protein VFH78_08660 [Candidatus Thermoplasmatota archaeon]|nr:hypothetical protein [Candidatus Thermoplasmatota archaeon]
MRLALDRIPLALDRLDHAMATGEEFTKSELAALAGCEHHAVAARMSELRLERGQEIVKRYDKTRKLWLYRRIIPEESSA